MIDIQQFILNKLDKLDEKLDEVREQNTSMRASFESHTVRDEEIHGEVVKLGDSIDRHSDLLDEYNRQLTEHMRRTEILENRVLPLVEEKNELKTVQKWRNSKIQSSIKIFGWLSAIGGFVIVVLEIISKL